jgi:hypothetical protein
MKRAVSVSLGSSKRNKEVEIELLGEKISLAREGTDGDIERATARFTELDGEVDALGVGGIDLWVDVYGQKYPLHAAHKLVRHVHRTPVVDGSGLKNTLERQVVETMIDELGADFAGGRVLLTAAIDRFGMSLAFFELGYDVVCADLMFGLGIPFPIRSLRQLKLMARLLMPIVGRLPISMLYPMGEKQEEIVPKFGKWYAWANVIAGDCHYIKRHMPQDLTDKVIITNTTTLEDLEMFQERRVSHVVTTTPQLDGRSFGTNLMEAALTAIAGKERPLSYEELNGLLKHLDLKPSIHRL